MNDKGGSGYTSSVCGNSTKVLSYFQILDKMNISSSMRTLSSDDLQQVRYSSNRILQHVSTLDRSGKEQIVKNSFYIQSLLMALEACRDFEVSRNIIGIILELIGKINTGSRCAQLVSQGVTQVVFNFLSKEVKSETFDDFIIQVHQVLAKLALKDRKFAVKARLSQSLQVTLSFIRSHTNASSLRTMQPVLTVLKHYAYNAINASFLGKNGIISHLFKILSNLNRKNPIMTKTVLDTLVLMVKSKSNSARVVGYGGVPILLQMYADWHKTDNKNRHVSLRKSILNVLKHVTNLKSARQAVIEADGVRLLYKTSEDIMEVRELESLIAIVSVILRKCFPRQKLPLSTNKAALVYKLPTSEFHIPQGLSKDAAQIMGIHINVDTKDDDDSSIDNDDDLSSDDEEENSKQLAGAVSNERADEMFVKRSLDDLKMYESFLSEVQDIEGSDVFVFSDSSPLSQRRFRPNPFSLPNIFDLSCPELGENFQSSSYRTDHSSYSQKLRQQDFLSFVDTKPATRESLDPVSAVNMKTGQPVFSLDLPISSLNIGARSKAQIGFSIPHIARAKTAKSTNSFDLFMESENKNESLKDRLGSDVEFSADEWVTPTDYYKCAQNTKCVGLFNKIAYPDLHGSKPVLKFEPLYEKKFGVQRAKVFEDIDRMINPETLINRVVYDLDEMLKYSEPSKSLPMLSNNDVARLGKAEQPFGHLHFNSQFESGNLRKAIQIREHEYDLILCPDVNSNHHHQWFYFEVSNMQAGKSYRFNIINNEKVNSQFNFGMQPVMYSVQDAVNGQPHWLRVGTDICYFKNHLTRSSQVTGGVKGKLYFTATFTIKFEHSYDVCYIAYHYPYTYTTLQCQLKKWENSVDHSAVYYKNQVLCQTISGNDVNLVTITNYPVGRDSLDQLRSKPYIFLSSRVHPGESNASWIMKGTIEHLLSDTPKAFALRDMYIFKIVPMLNPDGVINGNHRCGLTAEDLNRRWLVPCPKLHPAIYHTKGLLQYMKLMHRVPFVFCDYHGHSRRKNVFLYGCSPSLSWMTDDIDNPAILSDKTEDPGYKSLPRVLSQSAPAFSLSSCSFTVEKAKESTARVVVWRQIGVLRSYTMESSYCGCDTGPYSGLHINISHLQNMGKSFADALLKIRSRHYRPSLTALDLAVNDAKDMQIGEDIIFNYTKSKPGKNYSEESNDEEEDDVENDDMSNELEDGDLAL